MLHMLTTRSDHPRVALWASGWQGHVGIMPCGNQQTPCLLYYGAFALKGDYSASLPNSYTVPAPQASHVSPRRSKFQASELPTMARKSAAGNNMENSLPTEWLRGCSSFWFPTAYLFAPLHALRGSAYRYTSLLDGA